jgi:hypothetical protein
MKKQLPALLCLLSSVAFGQPVNDDPCGAINIPLINTGSAACNQLSVSLSGATYNPSIGVAAFCGNPSITHADTWYSFIMPASGKIIIHTSVESGSAYSDGGMELYSAASCSGPLTLQACDDDGGPGNMPLINFTGIAGNVYYIRFLQYNGGVNGDFNICISNPNPPLSTANVGIGLTGADSTLDLNGNLKVRGGAGLNNVTIGSTLTIKSGNPGVNKILTSDASGVASWQAPPAIPTAQSQHPVVIAGFETGNIPNEMDLSNGVNRGLRFRLEQVDNGNMYNDSVFIAPSAGVYAISLQLEATATGLTASPTANAMELQVEPLQPGNYYYARSYFPAAASGYASLGFNKLFFLNAGDRFQFNIVRLGTGGTVKIFGSSRNFISIYKVY